MNRLHTLTAAGQSVWLDYIDRRMLGDGSLERMIESDQLRGITSNPTIFEKALAESDAYDEQIEAAGADLSAAQVFELIETDDVRRACDIFAGVYRSTAGADGFVSIEVSPSVASDSSATIEEAQRLWATVNRPNVMVKVPGTIEGCDAISVLISRAINVNVTLLFSLDAHARVMEAYIGGLEERLRAGRPVSGIASVASFFVSRVDTEIDKRLRAASLERPHDAAHIGSLMGRAAVANAKLAWQQFTQKFSGERWQELAARGAAVQRPLWASTSTKNPAYRDVVYVESLIGPHTVNTMPPSTIEAFRDHGETSRTVDTDLPECERLFEVLDAVGIAMRDVTDTLLSEGLASFGKSFDSLISGLERKRSALGRQMARS
ncbi:MAG: transaldolase [Gemmatimonadota bacterium]